MKFNNFFNNNKIITIKNKFKTVTISVQLLLTYETFCIATIKNTCTKHCSRRFLSEGSHFHMGDEQSLLYPAQAFFAVLKMSFEGLRVWHCCVLFTFTVSSAHTVELSRFDLVSVWIFFTIEKILSHSALEFGIVITALTILDISGNLGVLVILFFIASTSPQKTSVLVPSVKLGRSMAGVV